MTFVIEWETTTHEDGGDDETLTTYTWALTHDGKLMNRTVEVMRNGAVDFVGEAYHVVARLRRTGDNARERCERYITRRYQHTLQKVL